MDHAAEEVPQPHRPLPTEGRLRVSFGIDTQVRVVQDHPGSDLWLTQAEIDSFTHQTAALTRKIQTDSMTAGSRCAATSIAVQDAFLGLETCLSPSCTTQEIISRRKAHLRAVFSEQARQLDAGIRDPEILAKISEEWSAWSRRRARSIALLHDV